MVTEHNGSNPHQILTETPQPAWTDDSEDGTPSGDIFEKAYAYHRPDLAEAAGIFPFFVPVSSESATTAIVRGHRVLMFGSNNYLGLTHDPRIREAAVEAIDTFGVACTGSRLLNGTVPIHAQAEERLAAFMRRESAVVFTTGFQANLSVISALAGRHDYLIVDSATHASIRDGCRLTPAKVLRFKHNDMADLKRALEAVPQGRGALIIVDGVYSMEGDMAKLPEIVDLKRRYGARLLVDDAHAIGVMGESGRGTSEHFGVEDQVDLITGTFSKSLASIGGFVVGDAKVLKYIRLVARPFLFSASPLPAAIGAALKALEIVETEPERREQLRRNAVQMREGLQKLGFDTGESETPIIPIVIGPELTMCLFWTSLVNNGVYTNAVIAPAVPPERALIRTSCTAAHTPAQIDEGLRILGEVGRTQGLI